MTAKTKESVKIGTRTATNKQFPKVNVNVYLGTELIAPSDYENLTINSQCVDKIVNEIKDNCKAS